MIRRFLLMVACSLPAVVGWGQIQIPAEVAIYQPIIATCPAAAGAQVLWESSAQVHYEVGEEGRRLFVWAPPGEHELRCDVFTVDWEAKRFSVERHRAKFKVVGGSPTPVPPTPPPDPVVPPPTPTPVGKLTAVIVRESEEDTPVLGGVFVALRTGEPAKWLRERGHTLVIIDDDTTDAQGNPIPLVQTFKSLGIAMPALFLLDSTNQVIHKSTLSATTTADGILQVIRDTGG